MRIKTTIVIVSVLLLTAGIAFAKDYEITKKAGMYNVTVKMDKNPPVVGDNNVSIEVTDASGHHARDAKVMVEYSMPAMSGMPAMTYRTEAALNGDAYQAKVNLSMSGSWNVSVKITRAGKTSTMKFTVDAK